jgi:Helix-turn-helix domain
MDEPLKRRIVDAICEEWERTEGDLDSMAVYNRLIGEGEFFPLSDSRLRWRCTGYGGCMSAYSLDLREKIVESVNKGVPKAETARRFGVDRATVKRYCKQLDERGTLEPRRSLPARDLNSTRRPGSCS